MNYLVLVLIALSLVMLGCERSVVNAADKSGGAAASKPATTQEDVGRVEKSNGEWKKILTAQQYEVLREKGTERAFTGAYWNNHEKGTYVCAACGLELFSSDTKFESGTGWPSFWQPLTPARVIEAVDNSHGMVRGEIVCARCGGHLGHVFDDGPKPTGQRYCMNSVSMKFIPAGDKQDNKDKK